MYLKTNSLGHHEIMNGDLDDIGIRSPRRSPRSNRRRPIVDPEVAEALRPWNGKSIRSSSTMRQMIVALSPLVTEGNQAAIWQTQVLQRKLQIPESQR